MRVVALLFLAILFLGVLPPPAAKADMIEPVFLLPAYRREAAAVVVGGDLLVFGGRDEQGATVNELTRLNLTTGATTTTSGIFPASSVRDCWNDPATVSSRAHMGIATDGRYVWLFGGQWKGSTCAVYEDVLRYDTQTGSMRRVATFDQNIADQTAVRVGHDIYLFGGYMCTFPNGCAPHHVSTIWRFDTTTAALERLSTTLPSGQVDIPALLVGSRILLFPYGGTTASPTWGEWELDPSSGALQRNTNTTAIPRGPLVASGGQLYSFGGPDEYSSGRACCGAVVYDLATRTVERGARVIDDPVAAFLHPTTGEPLYLDPRGVHRWRGDEPVLAPVDASLSFTCALSVSWREDLHRHPVDGFRVTLRNASGTFPNASWVAWDGRQRGWAGLGGWYGSTFDTPPNTSYEVLLEAVKGDASAPVRLSGTTKPAPPTPTGFRATHGPDYVKLEWTSRNTTWVEREDADGWRLLGSARENGTWTDAGLVPEVSYRYRLRGEANCMTSAPTETLSATPSRRPQAPAAPAVVRGPAPGEVTLHANASSPASDPILEYRYYERLADTSAFLGATSSNSFVVGGLEAGSTHAYQVSAVNAHGEGPLSPATTATAPTLPGPPSAPSTQRGPGAGQVTLRWGAPADTGGLAVSAYRVYLLNGSTATFLAETAQTSYTHGGLAAGAGVTLGATAVNALGEGAAANATGVAPTVPSAPLNMRSEHKVRPESESGMLPFGTRVAWSTPRDAGGLPILRYRLERSTDGTTFQALVTVSGSTFEHFDDRCPVGVQCVYQVRAENAVGVSAASSRVSTLGLSPRP